MVSNKLEEDEAINAILGILSNVSTSLTTREVGEEMHKLKLRCPDSTIVFLNRLRQKGLVHGERSKERRGWIWWID